MVKRINDDLYCGLSPIEQACVHHLSMRSDYRLPDGTALPFADTGVRHLQLSTAINLFSADPEIGHALLEKMYGDDAAQIYETIQELLVCTVDQVITPKELTNQESISKAARVVNPIPLFASLHAKGKIEIVSGVNYPKLTTNLGFNIVAIADQYRLEEQDKLARILAPYR